MPELAARAHRAVALDGEVPDLGAEAVRAAVQLAVEQHAAADAGAERHEQRVTQAARRAVRDLAERGDVGVVVDDDAGDCVAALSASRNGASRTFGRFGA